MAEMQKKTRKQKRYDANHLFQRHLYFCCLAHLINRISSQKDTIAIICIQRTIEERTILLAVAEKELWRKRLGLKPGSNVRLR